MGDVSSEGPHFITIDDDTDYDAIEVCQTTTFPHNNAQTDNAPSLIRPACWIWPNPRQYTVATRYPPRRAAMRSLAHCCVGQARRVGRAAALLPAAAGLDVSLYHHAAMSLNSAALLPTAAGRHGARRRRVRTDHRRARRRAASRPSALLTTPTHHIMTPAHGTAP